uniref:C-type lectin domain-containing protein n=1 Tax=Cyprinodon variegatus TaxID=28743 RepID=A0A3Q2EAN7_CYPVA
MISNFRNLKKIYLYIVSFLLIFKSAFGGLTHSQCREGWREYEDKCYFFSNDTKSWEEANAYCIEHTSHLMSIQDIHERVRMQTQVRLWVRTQIGTEIFWIGLNDKIVEGVWEWSDGKPFIEYLSYWMSGQPDNWNDEDCGELVGESFGQWNDENCNSKRKYICKYINGKETWMQPLSGLFPFMSTGTNFIVLFIIQTIECKEM